MGIFPPNPPPISNGVTRMSVSDTRRMGARELRTPNAPWVEVHTSILPSDFQMAVAL